MLTSNIDDHSARRELQRCSGEASKVSNEAPNIFEYFNGDLQGNSQRSFTFLVPRPVRSNEFNLSPDQRADIAILQSSRPFETDETSLPRSKKFSPNKFQALRSSPTSVTSFPAHDGIYSAVSGSYNQNPAISNNDSNLGSPPYFSPLRHRNLSRQLNQHSNYVSPFEDYSTLRHDHCASPYRNCDHYYAASQESRSSVRRVLFKYPRDASLDLMPSNHSMSPRIDYNDPRDWKTPAYSTPSHSTTSPFRPCAPKESSMVALNTNETMSPYCFPVNSRFGSTLSHSRPDRAAPQALSHLNHTCSQQASVPRVPRIPGPSITNSPINALIPTQPTPQNLRDNPERLAKVKTEMCVYFERGGIENCPFGDKCNYAHGEHELKNRYTTLLEMEDAGQIIDATTYLVRPCITWISTGACPFGRRCSFIHDPRIQGPSKYPSWLPVASGKTSAQVIVDRLFSHRESAAHQVNPLISQSIWENCRPSLRNDQRHKKEGNNPPGNILDDENEENVAWKDTYALVCNMGVPIFGDNKVSRRPHSRYTVSDLSEKLSEIQKLCIVRLVRSGDGKFQNESQGESDDNTWKYNKTNETQVQRSDLHRDYIFAPTHSVNGELCMVFQVRYFHLLDIDFRDNGNNTPDDIVKEISFEEYECRTTPWSSKSFPYTPREVVIVHEVAFAPKGEYNANISIWFDTQVTKLEQSQIKRSRRIKQKMKSQIKTGHTRPNANGALISCTTLVDFPSGPPEIDPFVYMIPAEDDEEYHLLIDAILEHRIDSIISDTKISTNGHDEGYTGLFNRMCMLKTTFCRMKRFSELWMWPKNQGNETVTHTTNAPNGNVTSYVPSSASSKSHHLDIVWETFVESLGMLDNFCHASANPQVQPKGRLAVFCSFKNVGTWGRIPRITHEKEQINLNDSTWKEILLGEPADGKWNTARQIHCDAARKKSSIEQNNSVETRNMPLSTTNFVPV